MVDDSKVALYYIENVRVYENKLHDGKYIWTIKPV